MIVWNTMLILLVISMLIVSVQSDYNHFNVGIMDLFLNDENEDWNENDPEYIHYLNKRNRRAKSLGIPLRGTKSADEMGIGDKIEIYCEPDCITTETWIETNHGRNSNSNRIYKPVPVPSPSVAPGHVCFPSGFMQMAPQTNCVPFDNPELKEYLDGELKKIMARFDEKFERKFKENIPDTPETTITDPPSINVGNEMVEPHGICEDMEKAYYAVVPGNCSAYYMCAFGDAHLGTCANGLLFCSSALQCVLKESAKCSEFSSALCRPDEVYLTENPKNKTNCLNYIYCAKGISIPQMCSQGTIFDPSVQNCVLESMYDCPYSG